MVANPTIYEFFAQTLLYPDGEFVAKIQARVRALPAPYAWAVAMVEALARESLEDLQIEHVRLFVNAYHGASCLPYESVYAEGKVLGEVTQEVAGTYAEWGVEQTGEMPDHAAVELAFAAHLARLQQAIEDADGRRQVLQALESFERDHLRAWLPSLGAGLQRTAELDFYRGLGATLQAIFAVAYQDASAPGDDDDV